MNETLVPNIHDIDTNILSWMQHTCIDLTDKLLMEGHLEA